MKTTIIRPIGYLLLTIALLAYVLPWWTNPPAGLTFAAYDLAEWSSLHPTVRASAPPLLTSLLLRIPLPCLLLGLLFAIAKQPRWVTFLIAMLVAAAMLPPFEFLTQYRSDPNYQQQFAIALMTLLIGILATTGWLRHLHLIVALILFTVSVISALVGIVQAGGLMTTFGLPGNVGIGGILHNAVGLAAAALIVRHILANKTGQPHHSAAPTNASG